MKKSSKKGEEATKKKKKVPPTEGVVGSPLQLVACLAAEGWPEGLLEYPESCVLQLKKDIEEMSKDRQVKILQILKSDTRTKLNCNKNGVFVNMTTLSLPVLRELHAFVAYVKEEEREFSIFEIQKQQLMQNHFFHVEKKLDDDDDDIEEEGEKCPTELSCAL